LRNLNPLTDAVIVRDYEQAFTANAKFADDGGMSAPEHAQNLSMSAAVGLDPADVHHYSVAVHSSCGGFLGYVDIAL